MKKTIKRGIIIILLMLPVIAFAHFIAFPQETRCMLIGFARFNKSGNIYFRPGAPVSSVDSLKQLQQTAEKNDHAFWKENYIPDYRIIFCNNEEDYNDYGVKGTPACTQRKFGASLVISREGLDSSIIAHELSHAVLYNNIGWYKTNFSIPCWFDEGLAMQTDDRDYYSIDTLQAKKDAGLELPDVTKMRSANEFFSGDREQVMLHFAVAKYTVHQWLQTHSLPKFIELLRAGKGFSVAYEQNNE